MYCIQVWGLRYAETLEKANLNFYKRHLHLSRGTPNFVIRLETGQLHISYYILKLCLSWLLNILQMENYRYPKICLQKLRSSIVSCSNSKYNWVLQLKELLNKVDFAEIMFVEDWVHLKTIIPQILDRYQNYLTAIDK